MFLLLSAQAQAQGPSGELPGVVFTAPESEAGAPIENSTGYVHLAWATAADAGGGVASGYELQSAPTADFASPLQHYRGPDSSSFVSGMEGRTHYFRVRAISGDGRTGAWSDPVVVEVTYVSRSKVKLLMLLGLLCLAATVAIIVVGSFQTRYQSAPSH